MSVEVSPLNALTLLAPADRGTEEGGGGGVLVLVRLRLRLGGEGGGGDLSPAGSPLLSACLAGCVKAEPCLQPASIKDLLNLPTLRPASCKAILSRLHQSLARMSHWTVLKRRLLS